MSWINNFIKHHPRLIRLSLRILIKLDNYCHHKISELASYLENGLHPKHRITNYHQYFIDRVTNTDNVLDLGCGVGHTAYQLAGVAKTVVGIDLSTANIVFAQAHYSRPNLRFTVGDATTHLFTEKFDKIVLSNVLEHLDNRPDFLRRLQSVGQVILLRVPLENRDWLTIYKKELGHEYRLDQTHKIEYRLDTLTQELDAAGWQIESFQINWGELWAVLKTK